MTALIHSLDTLHPILAGLIGSLVTGVLTLVGALPALVFRKMGPRVHDSLIGFAAGVMLAATFFSLIAPGLDAGADRGWGDWGAMGVVAAGIACGALLLFFAHDLIPHEHPIAGVEGPASERIRRIWLFIFAITIHNVPEGLSVGVAFGDGAATGVPVMIGIGLQNMPEGFAVAIALATIGYSRSFSVGVAGLTGMVEPLAGLLGAGLVWLIAPILPFGLGFAAGAMLFVISAEMIPETHRAGGETHATLSLIAGFLVMMALDVGLG